MKVLLLSLVISSSIAQRFTILFICIGLIFLAIDVFMRVKR